MVKISSDTLRYYDEIQLLNPDYINPSNNYRFYNENQVKELLYIMELKNCGFNLEEIKKILNLKDGEKIKKLFKKKKTYLLTQSKKISASIEIIEHKLKLMGDNYMKEKILIVDDAEFMRNIVKDLLEKNGYEVVLATDGADGIEKYKEYKPALILMDINMPKMDGIDATKEIRKIDSSAKIIMLSATLFAYHIANSFINGAVDFIAKPFQGERLVATIAKHLSEDIELDIKEVQAWQKEVEKTRVKFENDLTHINEEKLSLKLLETVRECIDLPLNFEELTRGLISSIKDFLDPNLKLLNQKYAQTSIDELLVRFTK